MGYRSQVILAVSKEVMPQFMSTMAKSPEARTMCFSDADRTVKDYDDGGGMLFYWDDIKWYNNFESVQAIEDFMHWAEGEEHEDKFKFLRTGEEFDDNEQRGWGFCNIYVNRSIEF